MIKCKLLIAYDGTSFSGWQIQPNGASIQEAITEAILLITKEHVSLVGSGRTDAGVHALGQTAHFSLEKPIDEKLLFRALNGILPPTIRILEVTQVPFSFHAQKSAIGKEYHYHIVPGQIVLPFDKPYVWHLPVPLDIPLLRQALSCFEGEKDFKAFANSSSEGAASKNSIRTIHRISLIETPYKLTIEFEGSGFLYKMIRNIVGMAVHVAMKRRPIEDIEKVFLSKDRRLAERAAPPSGLFLMKVFY